MAGEDAVGQDEAAGNDVGALAVVASASAPDGAAVHRALIEGGYRVRTVATGASVLDEVLEATPDILLVDLPTALGHADALAGVHTRHPALASLPVILLLPASWTGEVPEAIGRYVSDVVFHPVRPAELLHRAHAVIARRRRNGARRASAVRMREDMRGISARIRATNDPAVMVDHFLPGVGRALGAHHVALQVFDDDRVAAHGSSWTDPAEGTRMPLAAPAREHQDAALPLALTLWEDSATATFSTGPGAVPDADAVPAPGWLREGDAGRRTVHGVVAALGEGDTPFGLLWIMSEEQPQAWAGVAGALTQHVLGNLAHGLIQAQLISRQQQAVRKLQALNQAKTDFVGTVNHELRTPLASIAGYLEMILDGVGGELPAEASTMLQAVGRNTAKLSRLIENISALSSRESEAPGHGPVDIVHLLSELAGRAAQQASAGGIALECTLPDHPVTVSGDRGQLSAALEIVLSNAIKFTREQGTVSIGLAHEPDHGRVVVVVRDTGIGIPADDVPRLFDSFHRAANANHALPGAGVGLSIAKKTFEAHRGSITVESILDVGTAVAIMLPLLDHAAVG
ncbi:signal transduction histidine kinase/DNA-binding NarL/FixJ family response regulator [Arthrobacter sp. CAN_A2]|uniref:sensor histidine kinase n=1 Tax=Arthrobacter sp. CAN_A2 TaxID=2787718 RepID=UPI0018EF4546